MNRLSIWSELFIKPAWTWLVLTPVAMLGSAQSLRDELLSPEKAAQYRLLNYAPDWPWEVYTLVIVFLTVCILLESAYRIISVERKKFERINDLLPMALNFQHPWIHIGINTKKKSESTLQIGVVLENVGHRPIKYEMIDFDFKLGGGQKGDGVLHSRGGVIAPNRSRRFTFPGFQYVDASKRHLSGRLSYKVHYGYFDGEFLFFEEREMEVNCKKSTTRTRGYDQVDFLTITEDFDWLDGTR